MAKPRLKKELQHLNKDQLVEQMLDWYEKNKTGLHPAVMALRVKSQIYIMNIIMNHHD